MGEMVSYDKALGTVLSSARKLGCEDVPLGEANGRVLAVAAVSDVEMPPFDKSAMDGYACRAEDLDSPLEIVCTVAAGVMPEIGVGPGQCAKIMTGAAVPPGADIVVKVEDTRIEEGLVIVERKSGSTNICIRAEDVRSGDIVLEAGTVIGPAEVAVLAAVGMDPARVYKRPRIGIVATGSELVEPSGKPFGAMIRNSNSYQLFAQALKAGFEPVYLGIAKDSPEETGEAIERAIAVCDVLLMSGGVSMGDFDYVPGALESKGFDILFDRVAIKPGRPAVFAAGKGKYVFGLPGNPVSTYVLFEILVKPFAFRLMGAEYRPLVVRMPLASKISRKKKERRGFIPVDIDEKGTVVPVEYHGSAHIHAYAGAAGMTAFPEGVLTLEKGEPVSVIILR